MNRISRNIWFGPLVMALFLFSGFSSAAAQTPVEFKITVKGDLLFIDAVTRGPEPGLRMNPSPSFLELGFPKSQLKGKPFTKQIDKGLIRKVVTSSDNDKSVARIYVLNKPKASLKKTETGYRYTVRLQEMASTPRRTAAKPKQPKKAVPAKATPKPPTRTVTAPPKGRKAPISMVFKDTPLPQAIQQMAQAAGVQVELDPKLAGKVNGGFKNTPFDEALAKVLSGMGNQVSTTYNGSKVTVLKKAAPKAAPPEKKPPRTVTATNASQGDKVVREYFPYKTRSVMKALNAAELSFPDLTYKVDPILNILLVEGPAARVAELEKFLRAQSPK